MQLSDACAAIKSSNRIQFTYDDALRVVEIHSAGYTKENRPVVLAWQVRGGSKSKNPAPWRAFYLDQISDSLVLDEKSEAPREGYAGGGRSIHRIVHQL